MEVNDTYCYTPLPDIESIRLVTVYPGRSDERIECSIQHMRLNRTALQYEALSYVWGPPSSTEKIYCAGKTLPVTQSLSAALQRFRMPSAPRTIWIDQICINQANLEERKHQVALMTRIYKNAKKVLIWLGPDDTGLASDARDLTRQISNLYQDIPERLSLWFPSDEDLEACRLPKRSSPEWTALERFCQLPYFDRIWVIQETVMASDAVLVWGSVETDWNQFKGAVLWLMGNNCMLGSDGLKIEEMLIMISKRAYSMEFCLNSTRNRKTSEPRDRVFAFLGIASDITSSVDEFGELDVDYLKPVECVFADVTRYSIRQTQKLDFINNVHHERPPTTSDWPSWVPKWNEEDQRPMIQHLHDDADFTACGDTKVCLEKLNDKTVFIVEGLEIGRVEKAFFLSHYSNPSYLGGIHAAWTHVSSHLSEPFMGKPLIQAFTSTLTAGRTLSPGYPLLSVADDSVLMDYTAFIYSRMLEYIRDDLAVPVRPSTRCVRQEFDSAETALDLHQQLHSGLQEAPRRPSKESCDWFRGVMEFYHKDNEAAVVNGSQWMEKLFGHTGNGERFYGALLHTGSGRQIFTTSQGQIGLGPKALDANDIICVLFGGPTPYALRPLETGGYLFLGECFLYGYMDGEAIEAWKAGKLVVKDFLIK